MTDPSQRRIVCFGEMLLRLSPPQGELLMQGDALSVRPGGAEMNVAASLACLGAPVRVATVLPDNPLGHGARDELRRRGVEVSSVVFRPGRMGLYFMTPGAVRRPSEVLYDRADSAFARHCDTAFTWSDVLGDASWLHVSGVTPAIGPAGGRAAIQAVEAAEKAGVQVSFDGNFRSRLWNEWSGDPASTLGRMLAAASVAFADERDFALVLGQTFSGSDPHERRRSAAAAAFRAFPRLERICCTVREQDGVTAHSLSAVMLTRQDEIHAPAIRMEGVVDRVGGGDAFAAGVLFGLWNSWSDVRALTFGLHAAGLKHSVHGDFNPFSAAEVEAAVAAEGFDIRR